MNKNLKKVIAPVAAAAMVLAVPTGVYAEDGAQEKITFCLDWTAGLSIPSPFRERIPEVLC